MPNPRLLNFLMTFIVSTVFYYAAKPLGTGPAVVASTIGLVVGYIGSRWLMRRMFG